MWEARKRGIIRRRATFYKPERPGEAFDVSKCKRMVIIGWKREPMVRFVFLDALVYG